MISLKQFDNFTINVNNSILSNRDSFICNIDDNLLYIYFDNRFIPEINGLIINEPFYNLNYLYHNINDNKVIIQFIYDNLYIEIKFDIDPYKHNNIINLLYHIHFMDKKIDFNNLKHIKLHHYGELFILNIYNIKRIKQNHDYLIIVGKNWIVDYDGSESIGVLNYSNYYYDDYTKKYVIDGSVRTIVDDKLIEFNASDFDYSNNTFHTDYYPVYVVVEFRNRIRLDKRLQMT